MKKILNVKSLSLWLVIVMLGVLAVGAGVFAYSGSVKVVVEGDYIEAPSQELGEVQLGSGAANRIPHGYMDTSDGYYVDGTAVIDGSGNITGTGDNRLTSVVKTGSAAAFTVTSTALAANVCDNPLWVVTPATTTPTITLPATTTLFADCLTTDGDSIEVVVKTITTSTSIGIGSGGNVDIDSTATITADKSALLRFIRTSSTEYLLQIDNFNS